MHSETDASLASSGNCRHWATGLGGRQAAHSRPSDRRRRTPDGRACCDDVVVRQDGGSWKIEVADDWQRPMWGGSSSRGTRLTRGVMFSNFYRFVSPLRNCEHGSLKTSELILIQIGTSGLWSKDMEWSMLEVTRSKIKVTGRWNRSQKYFSTRYMKDYPTELMKPARHILR